MAKKEEKVNMFEEEEENVFEKAQAERMQEQAAITAAVTGQATPKGSRGGRLAKITLAIDEDDKDFIRIYAIQNHTTTSDLLHGWISDLREREKV